jgi:hypothetical protein
MACHPWSPPAGPPLARRWKFLPEIFQAVQAIIGMVPQHIIIGMPQFIMFCIMVQNMASISMLMPLVGIIMQVMPFLPISQLIVGIIGMPQHIIMGMPPQVIIIGMPRAIMSLIIVHMSLSISMVQPSPGVIMHFIPLSIISQVI